MKNVNVTLRVDADLKRQADALFSELGLNLTTAFNIFLRQAVRMQAIPFTISRGLTNKATLAAMREAERIASDSTVPAFASREDLVRSLES